MPSISSILVAATALLSISAPMVAAKKECRDGTYYCGKDLIAKDRGYEKNIDASLNAAKPRQPGDDNHEKYSLFYCREDGDVPFVTYCGKNKCRDGGPGRNDYCDWPRAGRT